MTTPALTCRELVELVTDYLDGALDPRTAEAFETHLQICPGCQRYVEQFRDTIAAVGHLRSDDLSAGTQAAVIDTFRRFRLCVVLSGLWL